MFTRSKYLHQLRGQKHCFVLWPKWNVRFDWKSERNILSKHGLLNKMKALKSLLSKIETIKWVLRIIDWDQIVQIACSGNCVRKIYIDTESLDTSCSNRKCRLRWFSRFCTIFQELCPENMRGWYSSYGEVRLTLTHFEDGSYTRKTLEKEVPQTPLALVSCRMWSSNS